jgi:periplasmic divalent cation tolerance protein
MTDKLVILSTAESQAEASRIAEELVERRLAACVNLVGRIQSFYHWDGKLQRAEEFLLIIKTDQAHEEQVRTAISQLNSYDLPECISLPVSDGSAEYLQWIENSMREAK